MNLVNVIGGFLSAGNSVAPAKYVESPLDGARFDVPLDEVIGESFKEFLAVRMESLSRRTEIDRRILGIFGVRTENPFKVAFGSPLKF